MASIGVLPEFYVEYVSAKLMCHQALTKHHLGSIKPHITSKYRGLMESTAGFLLPALFPFMFLCQLMHSPSKNLLHIPL